MISVPVSQRLGLGSILGYLLAGIFLGPEFPSIIGGLIGLSIVAVSIKYNFLVPKDKWDFMPLSEWPANWFRAR